MSIDNPFRTVKGGLVDRNNVFDFTFDGQMMRGYLGDTLASALLANGIHLTARSFKYHRPRGIMTAGSEEPNALVTLRTGGRREPNTRATVQELYQGLEAVSQNRWPSLGFDIMGVNDMVSPFLPAGFYYKTFMGPHKSWWYNIYEPFIRRAAGLGRASYERDPDHYTKMHAHCDVLVVGAGPAGLSAARALADAGKRVVLCDENPRVGGQLKYNADTVDGEAGREWAFQAERDLKGSGRAKVLTRTSVFGAYDQLTFGAIERVSDHMAEPVEGQPKTRFWVIFAKAVVYATGAIERPLIMDGNDRPGVMLAHSAQQYLNQYAVVPGKRVAIATNNDAAYSVAEDLARNGVEVVSMIDSRAQAPSHNGSFEVRTNSAITKVHAGLRGLRSKAVSVQAMADGALTGNADKLDVDAVLMSGGWTPLVHLTSHKASKPVWDEKLSAMLPGELMQGEHCAGSVIGAGTTQAAIEQGLQVASDILGFTVAVKELAQTRQDWNVTPFWKTPGSKRGFVEFQNDATAKDIALAEQEGMRSVEHMKRYTTLGMATDQGKLANINGLALLAQARGDSIPEVGTTTYRPPYTPFAIGSLAGHKQGKMFVPTRYTATHNWAEENGAHWTEAGMWMRAQWFTRQGETTWLQSAVREVNATRASVGINDVSTLGKIDIMGPDAGEFLNRLYTNGFAKLPVGKARYGLMLREDGHVFDDGTTSRLGENHYYMTTTTANAAKVLEHMELYHQAYWPELKVQYCSATDQWAAFAVAGPNSRKVLEKLVVGLDISNQAFPFMAVSDCQVLEGKRARLFRISFSGELAYEIAVDARYGQALWDKLLEAGEEFDITPYGLEALNIMRIEKGHVTGAELDGRVSAGDVGLGKMMSSKKDFIGRVSTLRTGMQDPQRQQMVGVRPVTSEGKVLAGGVDAQGNIEGPLLRSGALLYPTTGPRDYETQAGYMGSVCLSPTLGHMIGLAFIKGGHSRIGERLMMYSAVHKQRGEPCEVEVEIVSAHFLDPDNSRVMQ